MAGEFVNGISPYGMGMMPFYNSYDNAVMLDSLMDTSGGMFSMNGSLFNDPFASSYMSPFGGGMNYEQYYKNMEQYQNFMYDSQLRQNEKSRQVNFRANAPMESVQRQAEILHEKIVQNEQQQIIPALNKLLQSINDSNGSSSNATTEQLIARADNIYKQMYNTTLSEDIRKYGNVSYLQGLLQSISFGFADKTTAEENIARINGQPVSRWENTKKLAGNATGGAIVGAASMYGLLSLPALKKVFTSKPGFLAGVGAIVGALTGMTMSAIGKTPVIGKQENQA